MFGLLLAGWIVRRLGRQKSLIAAVLPGVLGWAMLGFSYNAYMMLIGRCVAAWRLTQRRAVFPKQVETSAIIYA